MNDIHGHSCNCDICQPYVPADKHKARHMGYYTRRFEVAIVMLMVLALTIWAVCR